MGELFSGLCARNRARALCADRDGPHHVSDCGCWRLRRRSDDERRRVSAQGSIIKAEGKWTDNARGRCRRGAERRGRRPIAAAAGGKRRSSDQESRIGHRGEAAHLAVPGAQRIPDVAAGDRGADHLVADASMRRWKSRSNPTRTPNPSKAPWYFLGLQEMLVFFDPWYAGVVLPSFIIVGLMLMPYLDINPKGNGYYTLQGAHLRDPDFLLRIPHSMGLVHHHRNFFPRPRMELVLARADLGSASGRGADQRRSAVYVRLPRLFAVGDVRPVRDRGVFRRRLRRLVLVDKTRPAGDPWSAFPGGGQEILEKPGDRCASGLPDSCSSRWSGWS